MSKPAKIVAIVAASIAGVIVAVVISAFILIHTSWFSNYVRGKISSTVEQATGAKVDIGSFHVDWTSLTIRIRNFVAHGTEPATAAPLLHVSLITLHIKLFSGIAHVINIAHVGVQQPQVDLIVYPNGSTNIPHPKIQKVATKPKSSSGSSLQTILNLKVGKFDIENGLIQVADRKSSFDARGENLRAILQYNGQAPSYQGGVSIDPLILHSFGRPPLDAHVNIPVTIEANSLRIANAQIRTAQSSMVLNASVANLNAPDIQAGLQAKISLPEIGRSFTMPIYPNAPGAPKILTADFAATVNEGTKQIRLQTAQLTLGNTRLRAEGALNGPNNGAIHFDGQLALDQLSSLMNSSTRASGALLLAGAVKLNGQGQYAVDGALNSRNLALSNGSTHLPNISLSAPFHADPSLIDINQLRLRALGGEMTAKLFIENMQQLSFESHLHSFDLPVIAAVATGKHIGYDGTINGSLKAQGNLKAKGTTGLEAHANLAIAPGYRGVPLRGRLVATYAGRTGAIDIDHSYLALPHSRLDISGALNQAASAGQRIDLNLVSRSFKDFLPAMDFASSEKPPQSLPVSLRAGGSATVQALITGNLKAPHIAAHAALTKFALEKAAFDQFSMNLAASPSGAEIQDGTLKGNALNGSFDAKIGLVKWKPLPRSPLTADLTMQSANIGKLLHIAGKSSFSAAGALRADAHLHGTYGNPQGKATLAISNGSLDSQPFQRVYANVNFGDRLIAISPFEADIAGARIELTGSLHHPSDSFTTGLAQFQLQAQNLQLAKLELVQRENRGIAGLIQLQAALIANITKPNGKTQVNVSNVSANFSATGLELEHQSAGDLTATARTVNGAVQYQLTSDIAGSQVHVAGHTALAKNYETVADASIQHLAIGKTLELADVNSIPVTGTLSATAHVAGTMQAPSANLKFALTQADVYQQPINSLSGNMQYSPTRVTIPAIALDTPAGALNLSAEFSHPANDFHTGSLSMKVNTTPIKLARIEKLASTRQGIGGTVRLAADLAASFHEQNGTRAVRVSSIDANASASGLQLDGHELGGATLTARTVGHHLTFALGSDLAQSEIHASGEATLAGDYPVRATLRFAKIHYANIYPFISSGPQTQPDFDTRIAGQVSIQGAVMKPADLSGQLRLATLEVRTLPRPSPTGAPAKNSITLQNQGPIEASLDRGVLRIQQFKITGPETNIGMAGGINLRNASSPLGLQLNADVNLAVLSEIDSNVYSTGQVTLRTAIHGTPTDPSLTGKVQLQNVNLQYTGSPNGISNANAVILLQGTTAQIENFTGQSGGGKVELAGFASYTNHTASFNIQAKASRVRILSSGVSIIISAEVRLIGNAKRSLAAGRVSLDRIAYSSGTDAGSILSSASGPPSSPSAPSAFASGMRLDIHVLSSPGLRVVSSYTQSVEVFADLTIRGTAANPGILGSVRVTNGTLVFFGNKYQVITGTVSFYNPYSIEPVLDVSLQTVTQGVRVTLGISGTMNDLKLSYHSDPPLTFQQIVQLLATNKTPTTNPTIAANQPPPPQQSTSQMGESAILGQAVANPVASRLQHVFGISEFKIDPTFQGSNGLPTARITLKQQITSNLTFTYIEDLSRTNAEIIRVEWNFTPKFSAVATRDWNGVVGVEFLYAFKKR